VALHLLLRIGIASDQTQKAILQWGILWHRDRGTENTDLSPHVYLGKNLVPETLHQRERECRIDADPSGNVVCTKATEARDMLEIIAGGKVSVGELTDPHT
jgi:hypothetical protein